MRARYFPAQVLLPELGVWSRVYVLLADDGLHVFRRTGEVAQWHQAVDWSRMPAVLPSAREGPQRDHRSPRRRGDGGAHHGRGLWLWLAAQGLGGTVMGEPGACRMTP